MIQLIFHKHFFESSALLTNVHQEKLSQLLEIIQKDPYDPRLHTKRLTGSLYGLLSFRITRDWRGMFRFLNPHTIHLLRIKHRKDIYR